jgi:prolyl 4-hydroxylase
MKRIELHEKIFLVEDFLTTEECQHYINEGLVKGFEEAKVNIDGEQTMFKGIRNNERILFFDNDLAISLFDKIKTFLPTNEDDYEAIGLNEMFRIYKYSKGERFKMHRDGSFKRNEKEQSRYSLIIYLNDDFDGGQTEFRDLFTVEPKTGTALCFRHPHKHEGKLITKGHKYVLRTDVMFRLKKD